MLALIANCHRDAQRTPRPWEPSDFHPTAKRRRRGARLTVERLHGLRAAFVR